MTVHVEYREQGADANHQIRAVLVDDESAQIVTYGHWYSAADGDLAYTQGQHMLRERTNGICVFCAGPTDTDSDWCQQCEDYIETPDAPREEES